MKINGRSILVATFLGMAMFILLAIGFVILESMITLPSAVFDSIEIVMFFCSLMVDALIAACYVIASYRKAPITPTEGALGGAISSELARLVIGGLAWCLTALTMFSMMGDAPTGVEPLKPMFPIYVLDSIGIYALGMMLFFITIPIGATSGAICVHLLRRRREHIASNG